MSLSTGGPWGGSTHVYPARKPRRRVDKRAALQAELQRLQLQLQQLEVSNNQLQHKQQVLSAVCDCTQKLLLILRVNGPRLEGPLHSGLSSSTQSALLALDCHVRDVMNDGQVVLAAPLEAKQQLLPPICHVTHLNDLLAANTASGGCLAVVQFGLSTIAASPDDYAHWSAAGLQQYASAIQRFAEDLSTMVIPCAPQQPPHLNTSSSTREPTTSSSGSSVNSAAAGSAAASCPPSDPPLALLTPCSSRLAPGVTPLDVALRSLRMVTDGLAAAALQPGLTFAVMRSNQLEQPSEAFWQAQAVALRLSQAQIDAIVAVVVVHKPLQETLVSEQEALLSEVETLLRNPAHQQQQQQQQLPGTNCGHNGAAEGSEHSQPVQEQPQLQEADQGDGPFASKVAIPAGTSSCAQVNSKAGATDAVQHAEGAQQQERVLSLNDKACRDGATASPTVTLRVIAGHLSDAAAASPDQVSGLNPADHNRLRELCRRMDAAAQKLAWVAACGAIHVVGCLTVHQGALFVINTQPYPNIFLAFGKWLAAKVAKGEGGDLAVDWLQLAATPDLYPSHARASVQAPAAAAAAAAVSDAAPTKQRGPCRDKAAAAAAAAAASPHPPTTRSTPRTPEGPQGSRLQQPATRALCRLAERPSAAPTPQRGSQPQQPGEEEAVAQQQQQQRQARVPTATAPFSSFSSPLLQEQPHPPPPPQYHHVMQPGACPAHMGAHPVQQQLLGVTCDDWQQLEALLFPHESPTAAGAGMWGHDSSTAPPPGSLSSAATPAGVTSAVVPVRLVGAAAPLSSRPQQQPMQQRQDHGHMLRGTEEAFEADIDVLDEILNLLAAEGEGQLLPAAPHMPGAAAPGAVTAGQAMHPKRGGRVWGPVPRGVAWAHPDQLQPTQEAYPPPRPPYAYPYPPAKQ